MSSTGQSSQSDSDSDSDFSQPESDQVVDLLNAGTISIHDALRALLHQCLVTNEDYAALDEAVTKLEDEIEDCETNVPLCTMPSGAEKSFNHRFVEAKLHRAQEERDAMLRRVYNEEVLPVVIGASNDDEIRQCLEDFCAVPEVNSDLPDSSLHESYINLCNTALDHFRNVELASLPASNSALDIRFMRNPNQQLVSEPVRALWERRIRYAPNVVCTSRKVQQALGTEKGFKGDSETETPTIAWPHVLQCVEMYRTSSTRGQGPSRSKRFEEDLFQMRCHRVADHPVGPAPNALKRNVDISDDTTGTDSPSNQWASIMFVNRQNIFLTPLFDILNEFPNFVAILFLLQRFTLKNWGIVPALNPAAIAALEGETDLPEYITLDFQNDCRDPWLNNPPSLLVIGSTYLNDQPRTLLGRATGVRPAHFEPAAKERVVCKIYNPEVARHHEGKLLASLHAIANEFDPTMHQHLPTLKAYADVPDTDTRWLASLFRRGIKGHRVTRIIILEELWPLERTLEVGTNDQGEAVGDEEGQTFIKAWLDVVKCHAFLWKNLVEHGDIGLNNMMFNPRLKCGVLIDFDLSVFRWGPHLPEIDQIDTIPFMSPRLLTPKLWERKIVLQYFDELEALCWILPYVWLGGTQAGSPIDCWKTHDYIACVKEKTWFLRRSTRWDDKYEPKATKLFVQYIVYGVIKVADRKLQALENEEFLRTLSETPDGGQEDTCTPDPGSFPGHDEKVLELFLSVLDEDITGLVPADYVTNFPRPTFTEPTVEDIEKGFGIVSMMMVK